MERALTELEELKVRYVYKEFKETGVQVGDFTYEAEAQTDIGLVEMKVLLEEELESEAKAESKRE